MTKAFIATACFMLAGALAGTASAQDIYARIGDLPGSATAKGHEGWIELSSLSDGMSVPSPTTNTGAARTGKVNFDFITLTKPVDAASIKLRELGANGRTIPRVEIEVVRVGQQAVLAYRLELTNVTVQSVKASFTDGGISQGQEAVSLAYGEIRWQFTPLDKATGRALTPVNSGWNVTQNRAQ